MRPAVFMVDDEEALVWSARQAFERERPNVDLRVYTDPIEALAAMKSTPPAVLITDLRMPQMSGLELLVLAREADPELPVIVMTAYGGPKVLDEISRRSGVEYLEKPASMEALFGLVDRILGRAGGFSGAIKLPLLPDLVQIYTLSMATGALSIRRGGEVGTIWFERGEIVHAECGSLAGEEAVYELLAWRSGAFSLKSGAQTGLRTIHSKWQTLLLEGCRLLDEASRWAPKAQPETGPKAEPPGEVRFGVEQPQELSAIELHLEAVIQRVRDVELAVVCDLGGDPIVAKVGSAEQARLTVDPLREILGAAERIAGGTSSETRIEVVRSEVVFGAWIQEASGVAALVCTQAGDMNRVARFRSAFARV